MSLSGLKILQWLFGHSLLMTNSFSVWEKRPFTNRYYLIYPASFSPVYLPNCQLHHLYSLYSHDPLLFLNLSNPMILCFFLVLPNPPFSYHPMIRFLLHPRPCCTMSRLLHTRIWLASLSFSLTGL